jgi:putative peptide zinc metalloprotease protein
MNDANVPNPAPDPPSIAERLRDVRVGTRRDLQVTRHLFRGQSSYLLCDPLTLQSHRLDPQDYRIFVNIDPARSLGEIFDGLVKAGRLDTEQEEAFYLFIYRLHTLNFLNLPVSDEKALYQKFLRRNAARRREKIFGILFLRVPLWNPDSFLQKTINYTRFLFSPWFFITWLILIAVAAFVSIKHWDQLIQPLEGILAAKNLPIMWVTLITLKLFHEFGHAYACKHYGGYVPEMGAYLIMFTPCAYVDATASWSLTRKLHRIIVCCAGMYVECFVAALAMLVWASTPPGLLHDVAYNVIVLASAVTILFNINPLMRFDGYYILSDFVEIPNLRRRASEYLNQWLKRVFLGVSPEKRNQGILAHCWLGAFGVAASLYRVSIMIGIGTVLAYKFKTVGFVIAALMIGGTFFKAIKSAVSYLWFSAEASPARVRAVLTSLLPLLGLPIAIGMIPVRSTVQAAGTLDGVEEHVIRTPIDGFLTDVINPHTTSTDPETTIARLQNDDCMERLADVEAKITAGIIKRDAALSVDPSKAVEEEKSRIAHEHERTQRLIDIENLTIQAGQAGRFLPIITTNDIGLFLPMGTPIARIVTGGWELNVLLNEEQLADADPKIGQQVEIRTSAQPDKPLTGIITSIDPAGSRVVLEQALTHLAGGDIAIDPRTGEARQPFVRVSMTIPSLDQNESARGMTARVRFEAERIPIATIIARRILRFTDKLKQS